MFSLRFILSALVAVALVQASTPATVDSPARLARHVKWSSRNNMSKSEWRKYRKMYKMRQAGNAGCKEGNANNAPKAIDSPAQKPSTTAQPVEPVTKPSPAVQIRTRTRTSVQAPPATTSPPTQPAPVSSTTPEPEPEEPETPPTSGLTADQAAVLKAHNDYRAKHGANPLTWDAKLHTAAQAWTDRCVYEHGGGKSTNSGENIAMGYKTMVDAFNAWGPGEEADYNPSAPTYSHFTQVVWKATTKLGCGSTMCSGRAFVSCIYNPAGNMYGPGGSTKYFDDNVQK